ncbi:MAG TPA: flavoprotein [Candidatus Bathyarchaeia archaeon]|nr:flavoprotein [Candidatus Bathyarchaeia archaeon]
MTIRIAWGFTGAGCWLPESYEILGRLLRNSEIEIDLFYSEAGREVSQCYGVFNTPVPQKIPFIDKVREIPNFNQDIFKPNFIEKYQWLGVNEDTSATEYFENIDQRNKDDDEEKNFDFDETFNDVIFEIDEGASFPTSATASIGKYDYVIISPATGNTIAKLNVGIADNLITNLVIMANKSKKTQVLITPTDYEIGDVKSYLPIILHPDTCRKCNECSALWACKPGAIRRKRGKVKLNRLKCIGCLDCVKFCRFTVISFLEETTITVQEREAKAVANLMKQEGFKIFRTPEDIYDYLMKDIK